MSAPGGGTPSVSAVTSAVQTFTSAAPGGAPAVSLVLDPEGDLLKIVEAIGRAS